MDWPRKFRDPENQPGRSPVRLALWALSVLPLLILGVAVWRVFFPANMPYDAVTQFRQAWTGRFDDWHPPLMAVVLHLFLKAGHNIGALTLVQCLAGLLGVRALALAWLRAFYGPQLPPLRATWIALAVTLVLMVPVTPLAFYLTTFWKDSWAAFLLVWMCALAVRIVSEPPTRPRVLALLALAAGLGLVRHNAVVVLPFVGLVLWSAHRRASPASRTSRKLPALTAFAGWTLAPVAAFVLAEVAVVRTFDVQHAQIERHLVAFDLVGVCALSEEACGDIPVIQKHLLVDNVGERYVHGNIVYSFWTEPFILDPAVYWHGKGLASAYLRTAWTHPVLLAQVKLRAFSNLLGFVGPYVYYYQGIVDNEFGLRPDPRFAPVRDRLVASLEAATRHRVLRLASMAHWVWILACLLWIVALAGGPGEPGRRSLALVLLLPLAFYLSYLGSTPAGDYRFLYPSTLVMQTVTLAALLGRAALGRQGTAAQETGRPEAEPSPGHP